MIWVSSSKPEIDGRSSSVNTRSMSSDLFFNVSHAFNPSRTAATALFQKLRLEEHTIHISFDGE